MKISYGVKAGLVIKGEVNSLVNELLTIKDRTPENVLQYAKDHKKSVLYKNITWENDTCAEKWRLREAQMILNHIIIKEIDEEEVNIRAFESVRIEEEDTEDIKRVYVNTIETISCPDLRRKVLNEIKCLMNQATNKLDAYNNLINILMKKDN